MVQIPVVEKTIFLLFVNCDLMMGPLMIAAYAIHEFLDEKSVNSVKAMVPYVQLSTNCKIGC